MTRLTRLVPILALLAFGCKQPAPAHRMGTSVNIAPTGIFQVIPATMDPNASNIPGAVGTRVQNAGGGNAWDKGPDGLWHALSWSSSSASGMAFGTNLTDASATVNPGTDLASAYLMPAATQTTNRTITVGTTGSPPTGLTTTFFRYDLSAFTLAIVNGGSGAGTQCTFLASPTKPQACSVTFDGTDWGSPTFYYLGS